MRSEVSFILHDLLGKKQHLCDCPKVVLDSSKGGLILGSLHKLSRKILFHIRTCGTRRFRGPAIESMGNVWYLPNVRDIEIWDWLMTEDKYLNWKLVCL